jgi:hypothetical protein
MGGRSKKLFDLNHETAKLNIAKNFYLWKFSFVMKANSVLFLALNEYNAGSPLNTLKLEQNWFEWQ